LFHIIIFSEGTSDINPDAVPYEEAPHWINIIQIELVIVSNWQVSNFSAMSCREQVACSSQNLANKVQCILYERHRVIKYKNTDNNVFKHNGLPNL
jgi:hypothetical protein